MRRRSQLIPWKVAGRVTEAHADADRVVQETGWVFNNVTGESLTLAEFVASGDGEVPVYLRVFGLDHDDEATRTLVEIGAGIGRMTCAFTRRFGTVHACDLDAGFLERCRQAVSQFGRLDRLHTVEVADGHTIDLPRDVADLTFSYITLQHCDRDDALGLVREAIRVTKPGGQIALNFRSWSAIDPLLLPVGSVVRALLRLPRLGPWLSRRRASTRLAWQANRLDPHQVMRTIDGRLGEATIWRHPTRTADLVGTGEARLAHFEGVNPNHWWLVATVK